MRFFLPFSLILSGCWPLIPGSWEDYTQETEEDTHSPDTNMIVDTDPSDPGSDTETTIPSSDESLIVGYVWSYDDYTEASWGQLQTPTDEYDPMAISFGISSGCASELSLDTWYAFAEDTLDFNGSASSVKIGSVTVTLSDYYGTVWYGNTEQGVSGSVSLSYNGSEPFPEDIGTLPSSSAIDVNASDSDVQFDWGTIANTDRLLGLVYLSDSEGNLLESQFCVVPMSEGNLTIPFSDFSQWNTAAYISALTIVEDTVDLEIPGTNEFARFSLMKGETTSWSLE